MRGEIKESLRCRSWKIDCFSPLGNVKSFGLVLFSSALARIQYKFFDPCIVASELRRRGLTSSIPSGGSEVTKLLTCGVMRFANGFQCIRMVLISSLFLGFRCQKVFPISGFHLLRSWRFLSPYSNPGITSPPIRILDGQSLPAAP